MINSVTAGTNGMPMYTIWLWSRRDGRSGGGPMFVPFDMIGSDGSVGGRKVQEQ